jgi:hypothetical protein
MIKEENREQLHRRRAGMSMSTAPRDLAAVKHALEPGLILAAHIIATVMIVMAVHDDARKLTPDITTGQVMFFDRETGGSPEKNGANFCCAFPTNVRTASVSYSFCGLPRGSISLGNRYLLKNIVAPPGFTRVHE